MDVLSPERLYIRDIRALPPDLYSYSWAIAPTFSSSDTSRYRCSAAIDAPPQVLDRLQPHPDLIQEKWQCVFGTGLSGGDSTLQPLLLKDCSQLAMGINHRFGHSGGTVWLLSKV